MLQFNSQRYYHFLLTNFFILICCKLAFSDIPVQTDSSAGYVIEQDSSIAQIQPGPHNGGGETTGFPFFEHVPNMKLVFKKRVLHPGSAIGYHLQEHDEIYYIISGQGELVMNESRSIVDAGTAILTRSGTSHSLAQSGKEDLVIFIIYNQ
jgi:mannose-6-phosphate isomerase-like protein (cupin superfamily)